MPYEIKKLPDQEEWQVINKDSGDVKAKHATEDDAKKQVRLLHMLEREHG